jgi:hypothetical protein
MIDVSLIKEDHHMHEFTELIYRCTSFSLGSLNKVNDEIIKELENSAATSLVKNLQMINLHKAVLAVGMFSIFEAHLQDNLDCTNGFSEAKRILNEAGENHIKECFNDLILAVNVLKHGKGRSYEALIERASQLPFRVKLPDESFFYEGDVSEISTLVEVDDSFVELCSKSIEDVSNVLRKTYPSFN